MKIYKLLSISKIPFRYFYRLKKKTRFFFQGEFPVLAFSYSTCAQVQLQSISVTEVMIRFMSSVSLYSFYLSLG